MFPEWIKVLRWVTSLSTISKQGIILISGSLLPELFWKKKKPISTKEELQEVFICSECSFWWCLWIKYFPNVLDSYIWYKGDVNYFKCQRNFWKMYWEEFGNGGFTLKLFLSILCRRNLITLELGQGKWSFFWKAAF